jgi:8-oxo-dGTP pyrophosphatase MutT (NUDIX family)
MNDDAPAPLSSQIRRITDLRLTFRDAPWSFAERHRDAIAAHFETCRQARPALWNGRVMLMRGPEFEGQTLTAGFFETGFADFLAWRDWGFPDPAVYNAFGMGALRANDAAFLLGEMAGHTANAGRIYFPSGTPDAKDRCGDIVDIAGSVAREVEEETGLTPADYSAHGDWWCVTSGQLVALIRILDVNLPGEALRAMVERNLRTQALPELSAVHLVRSMDDVTPAMADFVVTGLEAMFAATTANDAMTSTGKAQDG